MNQEQRQELADALLKFCLRCLKGEASKEEMEYLPTTLQILTGGWW